MKLLSTTLLLVAMWCGTAPTSSAQILFGADLIGAEENPPVSTNAGGYGSCVVNPDDSVTYRVVTYGLSGTAAHVHDGDVGVNGPVLFGLSGGPTEWSGTSAPLSPSELADLRAGGLYFNVHTSANPGGEIRGQIAARPLRFGARLKGEQEVPPVGSPHEGDGSFVVNADLSISYDVTTTVPDATAAHIHTGPFGTNGGVLFPLSGGPSNWSGTTAPMSVADFNALQSEGLYCNVHTSANPGGEIRGQLISSGVPYGPPCPSSTGATPSLSAGGAPMTDGLLEVEIAGGLPGGFGFLFVSLSDGAANTKGACNLVVGPKLLLLGLPLNGSGALSLAPRLPAISADFDLYVQYLGLDPAAPNGGLYNTNGNRIPFRDL